MLKIHLNGRTLTVTKGAFKSLYAPLGYEIIGTEGDTDVPLGPGNENAQGMQHDGSEDDLSPIEHDNMPDDDEPDDEDEDLDEKPLSEMSFKELKDYAAQLGFNANGLSSKKEIRDLILKYKG